MGTVTFWKLYIILALPGIITVIFDACDRVKNKHNASVRVSGFLITVCFLGSLIGIFAFMSNWFWVEKPEFWFVNMMICCYVGLTIIIFNLHNTRITYCLDSDDILFVARFRRKRFKIYEITRIYLSDDYLDIYVGEKRYRCDNVYLTGAVEFEKTVKGYHKKRKVNTESI